MNILKRLFRSKTNFDETSLHHTTEKPLNTEKRTYNKNCNEDSLEEIKLEELVSLTKLNGSGKDVFRIWKIMLNLKEWHYVSTYQMDIQNVKPFIGVIDNTPWIYIFSSSEKAIEFSKLDNRFQGENGETQVLTKSVEDSLTLISKLKEQGVFGVIVNDNDEKINADFNIPINILEQIVEIAKSEK